MLSNAAGIFKTAGGDTTENVLLLQAPLVLRKFIFPPTES
jgi:hypothetical protein